MLHPCPSKSALPYQGLDGNTDGTALRVGHHEMVPAETPFKAVHLDAQDRDRAGAEQPPPLFDVPFPLKVGAHDEAESSEFGFLLRLHVVVVEEGGLDVQLRDEGVHPLVTGSDYCCAVLVEGAAHVNTVQPGIVAGADVGHGEVLVEHLTDDPMEHGPDVDGHDDSLSGASSLDVPAKRDWGPSTKHVIDVARAVVPEAVEGMSYGMPALKFEGKPLVGVVRAAKHVFPFSPAVIDAVASRLEGYSLSKGTIRLPEHPLPDDVLEDIVRLRRAEILK